MHHVYVIVSRIYGRLFLYLMNSKSDATYTRTYLLMRKQCLMFMLLFSRIWARWEKSIENKISKRYCRVVQTYCLGRAPTNLQNVSHLSNNHLFLPHILLCGLGVCTWAATTLDEIAVYSYKFRKGCRSMSTQAYTPKIPSGMGA